MQEGKKQDRGNFQSGILLLRPQHLDVWQVWNFVVGISILLIQKRPKRNHLQMSSKRRKHLARPTGYRFSQGGNDDDNKNSVANSGAC